MPTPRTSARRRCSCRSSSRSRTMVSGEPASPRAAGTRHRARARPGRLRPIVVGVVRRSRRLGRGDTCGGIARAAHLAPPAGVVRLRVRSPRLGGVVVALVGSPRPNRARTEAHGRLRRSGARTGPARPAQPRAAPPRADPCGDRRRGRLRARALPHGDAQSRRIRRCSARAAARVCECARRARRNRSRARYRPHRTRRRSTGARGDRGDGSPAGGDAAAHAESRCGRCARIGLRRGRPLRRRRRAVRPRRAPRRTRRSRGGRRRGTLTAQRRGRDTACTRRLDRRRRDDRLRGRHCACSGTRARARRTHTGACPGPWSPRRS